MSDGPISLTRRLFATSLAACALPSSGDALQSAHGFQLFDALLHRGKPNLQRAGLRPLPPVAQVWRQGASRDNVDEMGVKLALRQLSRATETFFIDIENWPVLNVSREVRRANIQKLLQVAAIARQYLPSAKFGFYGLPPAITYWPLVDNRPSERANWVETNRDLEALAEVVDFIFPSLYTFYDDRTGWLMYADATIREARRYGKPVFPFLWFEYHDSNFLLRNHELDVHTWIEELQFCKARCDGIVLWGGSERSWSESARWWQAVRKEFSLDA